MRKPVRVLAAGCFNRIHAAHLSMLRMARTFGDELVVVLAHDAHNRKAGAVPGKMRMRWMESLGLADQVVMGRPEGFAQTVRELRPGVVALGHDQHFPDRETAAVIEALAVEVVRLPWCVGRERAVLPPEAQTSHG
ncbi:MAG: adenylyltransferase/cytidyltransferase family protein [Elusimicrobia bacterium]|nr:adenylyltransferase/cytidyltransferase family protein [Elusimicrobiota bacterium]